MLDSDQSHHVRPDKIRVKASKGVFQLEGWSFEVRNKKNVTFHIVLHVSAVHVQCALALITTTAGY